MEINQIIITDKNYPPQLKTIADPPDTLYYTGNLQLVFRRCVAVVGSRKATSYGYETAKHLGKILASGGVSVVSGMAGGIDTCAHQGAVESGNTIAVLGCGVDVCYPAANKRLWENISKKGLILSEYPPGTPPAKFRFPQRNRIISGLSEACVIVQAGNNSGALITAELAADQGRTIYAIPGNINSPYNLGNNKLLKDGAQPLVILEDILWDMGISSNVRKSLELDLGREEMHIYNTLQKNGEMTIDQLCRALNMKPSSINGMITIMEIKGAIFTSFGKIFIAK